MTAVVEYQAELRTQAMHLQSQSLLITDAPTDNHGKGEQFSPTDLLATSLASCMLTVMGIKAQQLNIPLKGFKLSVNKIMESNPRRVGAIELIATIPTALQQIDARDKHILVKTAESCPVLKSLHPDLKISVHWSEWTTEIAASGE